VWGIVPAAGAGSRIQPLAFSKELLPVGSRRDGDVERPRAVSEYLIERMVLAGADRICFVISPGKSDILEYYGASVEGAHVCYAVQPRPGGLCDAIFRAVPFIHEAESAIVGLPDTIWFPTDALRALPSDVLAFLLFPVARPEFFDAVVTDATGAVQEIQVKQPKPSTNWVWGAFRMPGTVLHELHALWRSRGSSDEYVGTLVNAYLAAGGVACGVRAGTSYVDVGTLDGYREAIQLLAREHDHARRPASRPRTRTRHAVAPPAREPAASRGEGHGTG
jgi:dTDP-glucose pyrophosphorylase